MKILLPPNWPRPKGYANGVSVKPGRMIFVAGMIGWDEQCHFHSDHLADQVKQALQNIVDVLASDNAGPEHIVRMTWYLTSKTEYVAQLRDIGQAFKSIIGNFDIAMTAIEITALIEDQAKVEIEVTAVVPE
jgi:enamine deaminase RidA (YjgF/YER057c/UK114 family)